MNGLFHEALQDWLAQNGWLLHATIAVVLFAGIRWVFGGVRWWFGDRERNRLENLKLRYEIEALKKEHGLPLLPEDPAYRPGGSTNPAEAFDRGRRVGETLAGVSSLIRDAHRIHPLLAWSIAVLDMISGAFLATIALVITALALMGAAVNAQWGAGALVLLIFGSASYAAVKYASSAVRQIRYLSTLRKLGVGPI